jgi:Glycosyl transferases group 1
MDSKPHVLIPTRRLWYGLVSAGTMVDFENAMAAPASTDFLHLPRYVGRRETLRSGRRTASVSVGEGRYDLCLFPVFGPGEIASLRYVRRLRKACKRLVIYVFDAWTSQVALLRRYRRLWDSCDHVFVSFPRAVEQYRQILRCPVTYLPQAIEPSRFHANRVERPIHILSIGRRLESVHRTLLAVSVRRDLWYYFSEFRAPHAINLEESQLLLGRICQSARIQVCWPVEITHRVDARVGYSPRDGSPITARWFEAAASGSVVIGARPIDPEFDELFPYQRFVREINPDSHVEVEEAVVECLHTDPVDMKERQALAEHVRCKHSWESRCRTILETVL